MRAYDIRSLITALADTGSVLEMRPNFGTGMITALVRIEGRPLGLIANNSHHLGGAIDADGADKAARFIQLCDAFSIPMLSLCDTPGMMVGPEVEKTAQVRHVSRMFINAAKATIPFFTVVLRKGYGLGALAMAAGSGQASFFIVAWPSAEFGAMGLEGAIKLAYRKELAAIADPVDRKAWFEMMVAKSYEENKALSSATFLEIDDVIDPRETRRWIVRGLKSLPNPLPRRAGGFAMIPGRQAELQANENVAQQGENNERPGQGNRTEVHRERGRLPHPCSRNSEPESARGNSPCAGLSARRAPDLRIFAGVGTTHTRQSRHPLLRTRDQLCRTRPTERPLRCVAAHAGCAKGDRIAVFLPNCPQFVHLLLRHPEGRLHARTGESDVHGAGTGTTNSTTRSEHYRRARSVVAGAQAVAARVPLAHILCHILPRRIAGSAGKRRCPPS